MFGFVSAPCARCTRNSFPAWRGTFCGLARCLGREYGDPYRLLVNRDAAFIGLLGISIDPKEADWKQATCCNPLAAPFPVAEDHPAVRHAAAATICGLAAKLSDDSADEGILRRSLARLVRAASGPAVDRAVATLNSTSFPTASVVEALESQEAAEASDPRRADEPTSAAYAAIVSHLAVLLDTPAHSPALHHAGASLGSLVYWRDAWQDRREDAKRGRFNPFETLDPAWIHLRIVSSWEGFRSALGALPLRRNADLIAGIQSSTGRSHESFLNLQADGEPRKNPEKKSRQQDKNDGSRWWHHCDCCDCATCPRTGKGGCCDAACDSGPGDTGCCDCCPCDGCDCPCH